ncbi:MAG TPA: extracellular solute-binding protein [Gryllotalpicola sp.]
MNKKLALFAAVGLTAALALSGCSSSSSSSSGGTQDITFLTHWGPDQVKQLKSAAASYEKSHPKTKITVQAVPFGNLLSTLRTQGSSASGPTIAGVYDLWIPELVKDGITDKAPSSVANDVTSNYSKGVVTSASQKGTVYGIPNEVDLYQLNYNKALFAAAGIAQPPTTWDELTADAKKLATGGHQGIGFITNWDSGVVHPFLSLLASDGGSMLNDDGTKSALTSAQAEETAKLYQTLVDQKLTDTSMSTANASTTGPYLDNFANGKTGMIIMANWWESSLQQEMGSKFSDVGTAPIPVGPSGTASSAISYSWDTIVNAHASDAQKKAAWDFLSWLNGPDSGTGGSSEMGKILLSMGSMPSRTSDIQANQSTLGTPFLTPYVKALDDSTPFPTVLGGQQATDAFQKDLEALLNGQLSAKEAMSRGDSDINSALSAAQ